METQPRSQMTCLRKIARSARRLTSSKFSVQEFILGGLDSLFYRHGKRVSSSPLLYIAVCFLITGLCGIGFLKFKKENKNIKLWIPEDSSQRINSDWLWENFPPDKRYTSMIFVSDNVLVPEVIQAMYKVHKSVDSLVGANGDTWGDMCFQVPIVKPPSLADVLLGEEDKRRKKREEQTTFQNVESDFAPATELYIGAQDSQEQTTELYSEPAESQKTDDEWSKAVFYSLELYPDPYCDMVQGMPRACLEWSILELWANDGRYDEDTDSQIESLTQDSILEKVNNFNRSGVFLQTKSFTDYLGDITFDNQGKIVAARASLMQWFGKMNTTEALKNPVVDRDEPIDQRTLDFEEDLLKVLLNSSGYPEGLKSFPNVQRSFGDVFASNIQEDVTFSAASFVIMMIYVIVVLGKYGMVENRVNMTMAGLASVALGIVVSYGLCSGIGLEFGPMHNTLPFLLLGIGVDDMFVIVQSWDILSKRDASDSPISQKFGKTLAQSGVAITITSVTDVVAFASGGTTILPALRSFCFFAAVGIIAVFFFQCTFFVAIMSLDQRRVKAKRNAFIPCYKHKKVTESPCCEANLSQKVFKLYGNLLMKLPMKIFVIFFTVGVTGIGIWGNILLEQKFVPQWFLPPDSYLSHWYKANEQYFPFGGDRVTLYLYNLDYVNELEQLNGLVERLTNQTDIIDNVDAWNNKFMEYIKLPSSEVSQWFGDFEEFKADRYFYHKLTQFLYSPTGAKYREQFRFNKPLQCGYSAAQIILSEITFTHKVFDGPKQHIPAMNRVKKIISESNLTGKVFPLSQGYAVWETDEVIARELYRNIGLAILCIFIVTLLLFGSLYYAFIVLFMVVLSIVDVAGVMHFWGLTIDTISSVTLIIAMGLCVDYSVHVAHWFVGETGNSRNERVQKTLYNIGPAVVHGGISTFLAFILLSNSKSHVFVTFFKVFLLVVVFGLFHGLTVLPVILSLIGPHKRHGIESEPPEENSIPSNLEQGTEIVETSSSNLSCTSDEDSVPAKVAET